MISMINSKIFIPFLITSRKKNKRNFLPVVNRKLIFKKIFHTYHQPVFRLCMQVSRRREIAENITVEVFAQFYEELGNLDQENNFGKRLRQLLICRLLDFQQNQQQFEN